MKKKKNRLPMGWVCPICGAVWSPAILRCLRFHGTQSETDVKPIGKVSIKKRLGLE